MSDPGTCLAIVSLALQVSKGLLGYYDLWSHADEHVAEIQRSLLALANIFTQLEITLGKPTLSGDIISIIRITMKGCNANVKKLEEILDKVKREGAPEKLRTKFKNFNRRILQIFHHGEIMRLQRVLDELREDLCMVVSLLSLNTTATSLEDLRKVHAELTALKSSNKEQIEMEKERTRESRRRALIEWLAAPDVSAAHLSAQNQREEGTGTWFLESDEFLEWTNTARSMWLAGDVGCGKTVLCSSVIEVLKSRAPQRGDQIAYFYFTFNDTNLHSITGFLRSMLRQLCLIETVDPLMEALYERCGLDPPSIKQMQTALLAYLARVCVLEKNSDVAQAPQVYMVLDGLDEIPYGSDRTTLLRVLDQIAEKAYPLLHILVSSRSESDIERGVVRSQCWRKFAYESGGARDDLGIYVTNQIKLTPRLASLPDHTKEDIQQKLVVGACGMFRWTSLQMQELKKRRILRGRDVQNILSSLPKGLDATYERVLLQIDSDLAYEAKTALQWLSCCLRPLYLEELIDAAIINPDGEVPFSEDYRISQFDLVDLLPGLIKVNPPPDSSEPRFLSKYYTVTLAHFSVKEYLVSSRILDSLSRTYAINIDLAHSHIVRSSLAYIGHCLSADSSFPHQQHGIDRFPLRLYAYSRWEMHAKLVSGYLDSVWARVLEIFQKPRAALMWSLLSQKPRGESIACHVDIPLQAFTSSDWPTHYLLCRAIGSGIEPLVRVILDSRLNLTGQPVLGNPFSLALISGSGSRPTNVLQGSSNLLSARSLLSPGEDSLPRMLLEFGYRPTARDLLLAVHHGTTPLLSLLIDRTENLLFSDLMEGLNQAVASRRFRIAHMLLRQLLSGTHSHTSRKFHTQAEAKKAIFDTILADAVRRDSSRLVTFLINSLTDDLLGQLNFNSSFLRAVVSGKHYAAIAVRRAQVARLSKKTVLRAEHWQRTMPRDELCVALLALLTSRCYATEPQTQTRGTRKRVGRSLIQPYIFGLSEEMVDQVLQLWLKLDGSFEPLDPQGLVCQDIPFKATMPNSTCELLAKKLVVFLLFNGRHYPFIQRLFYSLSIRRLFLLGPPRTLLVHHSSIYINWSLSWSHARRAPGNFGRLRTLLRTIPDIDAGSDNVARTTLLTSPQLQRYFSSFKSAPGWDSVARILPEKGFCSPLRHTWDSLVGEDSDAGTVILPPKQGPMAPAQICSQCLAHMLRRP